MPFNGSGTFTLTTSGQPVVTQTTISSTMFNGTLTELEVGLSTCITKDGQTTTTDVIPFAEGIDVGGPSTFTDSVVFTGAVEIDDARFLGEQGSAVASANDITLASNGNAFALTGTTQINRIATAGWKNGSVVYLLFDTSITVAHGTASGGGYGGILLNGSTSFSATANDTLTLILDGSGLWRELARSAN